MNNYFSNHCEHAMHAQDDLKILLKKDSMFVIIT